MKILYDHQIFSLQKFGGISRYFYEIITGLKKNFGIDVEHSVLYSSNEYLKDQNLFPLKKEYTYKDWIPTIRFRGIYRIFRLLQTIGLIPYPEQEMIRKILDKIENENFDLFHPTYYSPYFLKDLLRKKKPYVLTVHDMIHEKFSHYFPDAANVVSDKKRLIEKADFIIAISQNTKTDLLKYYHFPEDKIKVIYHGVSFSANADDKMPSDQLKKDYILFTGNRLYYKNFTFFLKSIEHIFREFPQIYLYCVGGGAFNQDEIRLIRELCLEDRIEQFRFDTDEELAVYYQNASAFVFPSRYEGFGIPLLEAFSCDCPVVCSNTSSFPEVAGDAAFYFNPDQSESIYETLKTALSEPEQRKEKIRNGRIQLKKFSWEKAARETYEVYQTIIKK